jgi:hypothetical protein
MSFYTGKKWFIIFINIKGHISLFDEEKNKRKHFISYKIELLIDVSRLLLINRLVIKSKSLIKRVTRLAINK